MNKSGEVGTILLLLTYFFSKNVHRHPTLVNFWITWLIYSVSYTLLLYDKQQYTNPDTLCRVQAAMVDGSPSLVVTAGLVAVIQIWKKVHRPPNSIYKLTLTAKQKSRISLVLFLFVPYMVFLVFSIGSALVGRKDFSLTNPMNGLYCSLHVDGFSRYSIPAYCTVVMTFLLGFEVAISYKYWRTRATTARAFTLLKRDLPFSLILRMLLFSVVSVMVISIGIIYMSNWLVPWPYMMQATLPLFSLKLLQITEMAISESNLARLPPVGILEIASASGSRTRFSSAPSSAVERGTVSGEETV
ncbi:hypothetical protein LENED_000275 [Lentinula edodes]|uniref:Pheromone receptor n=1 Tax=Lentinula edodes TaxID=5353 RepID=A0A1Q3DV35_LENED|nr:hypothetical protein LENED_000275 [Lentinula edodes]